jgi:hypothetical protein
MHSNSPVGDVQPVIHTTSPAERRFLRLMQAGLFAAFLIIAVGYSVLIPPGEGVDEIGHFNYVLYVKEHWALPIQPMRREAGVQVWMGHHPPLYYVLGALTIAGIDTADVDNTLRTNPHFVWKENDGSNGWNVMLHFGQDGLPIGPRSCYSRSIAGFHLGLRRWLASIHRSFS